MSILSTVIVMPALNIDDELARLSNMSGTKVTVIGDQGLLFASGHERRVRVENGPLFIECSAATAAKFGLQPTST